MALARRRPASGVPARGRICRCRRRRMRADRRRAGRGRRPGHEPVAPDQMEDRTGLPPDGLYRPGHVFKLYPGSENRLFHLNRPLIGADHWVDSAHTASKTDILLILPARHPEPCGLPAAPAGPIPAASAEHTGR